ncbi:MAG TPA: SPOR domain-containing protein [Allosphingosinicella sp.]|jgi:Flp pilus assembly protein TadD
MTSIKLKRFAVGAALLAGSWLASGAAFAQAAHYPPGAMVQSLKEDSAAALTRHLRDLNSSPRNLTSLLGAGHAALDVGDPQAALTFFARAEEVAPRDGRVKAGMGSAFVQTEQAQPALRFFAEAVAYGAPLSLFAKDRGLAFDMIGDPVRAQADYAFALQRGSDAEVERRMALSKAISGDQKGALAVLDPQVRRGDRAGWRARAFVLALTGDAAGAVQAARSAMPAQARAMGPFFARLPQLSAADRAMAVHFGRFPVNWQASANSNAQYAQNQAAMPTSAGRPDPSQPALGRQTPAPAGRATARYPAREPYDQPRRNTQPAPALVQPLPQAVPAPAQPVAQAVPAPAQPVAQAVPAPAQPIVAQPEEAQPAQPRTPPEAQPVPVQATPARSSLSESFDFDDVVATVEALPAAGAAAVADKPVQLAEANQPKTPPAKPAPAKPALAKPAPAKPAAAKSGAAKPAPEKKAESPKPKEPSRVWVQLAAAQDKSAFPGEFRRLKGKAPELLSGKSAWTAPMGKTNRLLVGPFKTEKEAREFVNKLSREQIDGFSWASDEGQKVEKLPSK